MMAMLRMCSMFVSVSGCWSECKRAANMRRGQGVVNGPPCNEGRVAGSATRDRSEISASPRRKTVRNLRNLWTARRRFVHITRASEAMGQQSNKVQKRRRRQNYLERKNAKSKDAASGSKAKVRRPVVKK